MLIKAKKESYVTKSEKLLKARYELNEVAIKLIAILYSNVKRSDEIGKDYEMRVEDISKLLNKDYGELYNEIKKAVEELMSNPVFIPDDDNPKNYVAFNWISDAKYKNGTITFTISKQLKPFILDLQEKFLKYKLENILPLRSVYVIRLYEILKDWYEKSKRYGNKAEKIIELKELREMLEIPKSYRFTDIKRQIIVKTQKELKTHTDIIFDFEEIKTGRKITHIKFIIQGNSKKIISKNSQNVEENNIVIEEKPKPTDFKNLKFKEFKQVLVDNYAGYYLGEYENKSITLSESGYIELNGKRVGADESFDVWEELFINRANLQPKSKEEFEEIKKAKEEEEKNNYLEKLRKEYRFRKIEVNVKNAFGNVNKIMYEVIDFLPPKNGEERCFDLVVKGEDGRTYKFDNVRYDIFVSYLV